MFNQISLRGKLLLFWLFCVSLAVVVGILMAGIYVQTAEVRIREAESRVTNACLMMAADYNQSGDDSTAMVTNILNNFSGVEGGVWTAADGFIAYAFPSYVGTGFKTDLPGSEIQRIQAMNASVMQTGLLRDETQIGEREAIVLHACPLKNNSQQLTAVGWTMARVPIEHAATDRRLLMGMASLFLFVFIASIVLGRIALLWSRRLKSIENSLQNTDILKWQNIAPLGERELDHLVNAINQSQQRLLETQQQLAQADRLAALGQMTAGIAHEIRNPLAAMRLRAENALANPSERSELAIQTILQQISRLDLLLDNLLKITQPIRLDKKLHNVNDWLQNQLNGFQEIARDKGIRLSAEFHVTNWTFDSVLLSRALENLLKNALHHTPAGGAVTVKIVTENQQMVLQVSDTGQGIKIERQQRIFEPFVTGTSAGTGLGLTIVREIAQAHGGTAACIPSSRGACLEIRIA